MVGFGCIGKVLEGYRVGWMEWERSWKVIKKHLMPFEGGDHHQLLGSASVPAERAEGRGNRATEGGGKRPGGGEGEGLRRDPPHPRGGFLTPPPLFVFPPFFGLFRRRAGGGRGTTARSGRWISRGSVSTQVGCWKGPGRGVGGVRRVLEGHRIGWKVGGWLGRVLEGHGMSWKGPGRV